jgi:DNA polymerase I-like protein with 3'-5' exonuclease and polymerase domains
LQNLPKREVTDPLYDVRACIVAGPGNVLVEADLAGAEAWVTAALCGDEDLLTKLRTPGFKVHAWTASRIFGVPMESVAKDSMHYVLGKMARHALNYGMQWSTYQRNVNSEADKTGVSIAAIDAQRVVQGYHSLHPLLEPWWRRAQGTLRRDGQLTTCFGRTRSFFGRGRSEWLSETHREAIAFEPQSTVADLLNRGLNRWWARYEGKLGNAVMQVHDAVVLEVPEAKAALAVTQLRHCLEESIIVNGISITIPVDIKTLKHWGLEG